MNLQTRVEKLELVAGAACECVKQPVEHVYVPDRGDTPPDANERCQVCGRVTRIVHTVNCLPELWDAIRG